MRFWHVLAMIILFAVIIMFKNNKAVQAPRIVYDYYVVGSERRMIYFDSIESVRFEGKTAVMVRFDDTIRIDSVVYFRKMKTYKIK